MPSNSQSSGLTWQKRMADFMSNLLIGAPGPNENTMFTATSKWECCTGKSSCEMKSLMDEPLGAEGSIIILQDPSFFGTRPTEEHCRLGRGGTLNRQLWLIREVRVEQRGRIKLRESRRLKYTPLTKLLARQARPGTTHNGSGTEAETYSSISATNQHQLRQIIYQSNLQSFFVWI